MREKNYKVEIVICISEKELTQYNFVKVGVIRGEKIGDSFVFHESKKEELKTTVARIWKVCHQNNAKWDTRISELDESGLPKSLYLETTVYLDEITYNTLNKNFVVNILDILDQFRFNQIGLKECKQLMADKLQSVEPEMLMEPLQVAHDYVFGLLKHKEISEHKANDMSFVLWSPLYKFFS